MSVEIFKKLTALLTERNARFRTLEHAPGGRSSAEVAKIRGTALGQGAKALVCVVKGNGVKRHVLAVLPADKQADLALLAKNLGGKKASLASPKEVRELTDCEFGAIPPFSFHPSLTLVADPLLFGRYNELAFNAGTLENSIILNAQDYQRIADPQLTAFAK